MTRHGCNRRCHTGLARRSTAGTPRECTEDMCEASQLKPVMHVRFVNSFQQAKGLESAQPQRVVIELAQLHWWREHNVHGRADSFRLGENVLLDWAKIVDCGDAPLTFLVRSHTD